VLGLTRGDAAKSLSRLATAAARDHEIDAGGVLRRVLLKGGPNEASAMCSGEQSRGLLVGTTLRLRGKDEGTARVMEVIAAQQCSEEPGWLLQRRAITGSSREEGQRRCKVIGARCRR
jgi:hypothetical protein